MHLFEQLLQRGLSLWDQRETEIRGETYPRLSISLYPSERLLDILIRELSLEAPC